MSNKVLLKKSSVASKVPLASDLDYGELALNYADGLLYYKKSDNTIHSLGGSGGGGSGTVTEIDTGTGLTGGPITSTGTISIDTSVVAQKSDTHYIGTTSVALNRASSNLALTGISSVTLPGSTSGSVQLIPTAVAGSGTILTLPATTGTVITSGDSGTVTNTMLAGSISTSKISGLAASATTDTTNASNITSGTLPNSRLSSIPNSALANSSTTIGTTSISLGASSTTLAGLTSITSTSFVGALTGNADTVTNGVYTNGSYSDPSWLSISKSKVGLGSVENTALSTWAGTSNLTTLGTITNGTWNGATVGVSYGGTGVTTSTGSGSVVLSNSPTLVTPALGAPASGDFSSGTFTWPTFNQNTTGTASSAAILTTARNINGVSFNGSASITIKASTTNVLTIGTGLSGTSFDGSSSVTIAIDSTVATLSGSQTLTNKTLTSPTITAPTVTGGLSTDTITTTGVGVIGGDLTVTGNLIINGTTTTSNSTNVAYADSLIELHYSNGGVLSSNDGKDIGIRMHYYDTSDKNAALVFANDTKRLEFYSNGTETDGVFSGTYGVYRGAQYESVATTGTAPFIVSSTTRVANLNAATAGNADTVTNGIYTTDTGTVTNTMLAGSISTSKISGLAASATTDTTNASNITSGTLPNARLVSVPNSSLANSSVTIGTTAISLGASSTTLSGLSSVSSTTFTGALAGNADTATKLATARTINGVSFDGSANITVHTAGTGISISGTSVAIDSSVATLTGTQTLSNKSLNAFDTKTGSTTVSNTAVAQATVATSTLTAIDSFATSTYRSAKYIVQITQGTNYQVSEIMVIHNGTTTTMTEYGMMNTNGVLGSFTTDISGGNVRLLVTMSSATSSTINITRTAMAV